jgi:outer membrane lipoprotein SlyB
MRTRTLAIAACLGLALAGCGGSSGDAASCRKAIIAKSNQSSASGGEVAPGWPASCNGLSEEKKQAIASQVVSDFTGSGGVMPTP